MWSIDGMRVEVRPKFPSGKIVVTNNGAVVHEEGLKPAGEWKIPIRGESYTLTRVKKFAGPVATLTAADGRIVPATAKFVAPRAAPAGSLCFSHRAPASFACARCGNFCCPKCAGSDRTHCDTCAGRLTAEMERNAAALAWAAPVVVFGILGGVLGAAFGGIAAAAVVAIVKRTESKAMKIVAAVGIYGVATVLWLIVAALISGARHKA